MADTLEQLWISYNNIEKLKGIAVLKKLKVRCTWAELELIVYMQYTLGGTSQLICASHTFPLIHFMFVCSQSPCYVLCVMCYVSMLWLLFLMSLCFRQLLHVSLVKPAPKTHTHTI